MSQQALKEDLKYIRTVDDNGMDYLLLFPGYILHSQAARGRTVLSAGFIDMGALRCHGESLSLKLKSDPRDTLLLRVMFRRPALYSAEIKPASPGRYRYIISGPNDTKVDGEYRGTKKATEQHVEKTLKRLNALRGETFHISFAKYEKRAAS